MVTGRSLCVSESQETKAIECLTLPVSAQNGQLRAPAALLSLPCTRHPARRGGGAPDECHWLLGPPRARRLARH